MSPIVIEAHPDYYDYLHRLILNDNGTCEFSDGGGQIINGVWKGTWTRNEKTLTLVYDTIEEVYSDPVVDTNINPITITAELEITNETTLFFSGYSFSISNETWKFDKSPCPGFDNQDTNLFNILEGVNKQRTPLIFYKMNSGKISVPSYITTDLARISNKTVWVLKSETDFSPVVQSILERGKDIKMDKEDYDEIHTLIKKCGIDFFDFKTNTVDCDKVEQIKRLLNDASKKSTLNDLTYVLREIEEFNKLVIKINQFRSMNQQVSELN